MAQVHPLLTRAKSLCEVFTVRPHQRGYVIWRLRDWSAKRGGWSPEAYASTRESAEAVILAKFPGLKEAEPPAEQVPAIMADAFFDYGGWA